MNKQKLPYLSPRLRSTALQAQAMKLACTSPDPTSACFPLSATNCVNCPALGGACVDAAACNAP